MIEDMIDLEEYKLDLFSFLYGEYIDTIYSEKSKTHEYYNKIFSQFPSASMDKEDIASKILLTCTNYAIDDIKIFLEENKL